VAAMIASQLPDYADRLGDPVLLETFALNAVERDPGGSLDRGILAPLHSLRTPVEEVRYLLIDALDEALTLNEGDQSANIAGPPTRTVAQLAADRRYES
jgi:hypothetical protein